MAGDNYYLLTALPGLGELGSVPPLSMGELLEKALAADGDAVLLEALILSDDLLQRQALLAGEIEEPEPVVLTVPQMRGEEPLPEYLALPSKEVTSQFTPDSIWESYYRHASSVADARGSGFLARWVEYEVGLRNALVMARAKALDIDGQEYLVAPDVGSPRDSFAGVISEWTAAPDPFAALRVLDEARWAWLSENDGWFTFSDDELIAYGAKLMLLWRWYRLSRETPVAVE